MTGSAPPPDWRAVAASYDRGAAGYDDRHDDRPATRARTRRLDRLVVAATAGARRVLEIGVGTGRLLAQVPAPIRIGVDVAAGMVARAAARGLVVVRADGHALPFAAGAFDAVIAGKGSLRYLDPARALAEAARVVVPGGAIGLHLYGGATWSPRRPAPRHRGLWEPATTDELRATIAGAGLTIDRLHRLRSIRIWPYLLEIPEVADRAAPVQLWSHVVAVLRRP